MRHQGKSAILGNRLGVIVFALAGAAVSLAITGFVFAAENNIFHLPIVARLYDEPQYADDAFIQSLRSYSSGLWLLLRGSAGWIEPSRLFLILAFVSRFLAFAGFLALAQTVGVQSSGGRALFTAVICVTFLLDGESLAGDGGLFLNTFSHSEVCNGLFLLALASLLQRRIAAAGALAGLAFFVNAFMGAWTFFILAAVFLWQIASAEAPWRTALFRGAIGAVLASALAAPALLSILSNPDFGKPLAFDYVAYLEEYYPDHFLFWENGAGEKIGLALIALAGAVALFALGKRARPLQVALLATCLIYAIGVAAPYITHSPAVLNLHLLRVSAFVHLLSAFALAALIAKRFFDASALSSVGAALIAIAVTLPGGDTVRYACLGFALCLALADRFRKPPEPGALGTKYPALRYVLVLWLMCVAPYLWSKHAQENLKVQEWIGEWREVGRWAEANTPPRAAFLVPLANWNDEATPEEEAAAGRARAIFEFVSRRKVWVDFKRGAAVMWRPSYYEEWHRRVEEVSELENRRDRLRYAKEKGLSHVVELCLKGREKDAVFATKRLCVYRAPAAQARPKKRKAAA